jgi:hypothetical protein
MGRESQLEILRETMLRVAAAETSCYPEVYDKEKSPLDGHCGAVSAMIQGVFGGDIVTGKVNGVTHYWNRFEDGVEVDLTSCQFGGDGYTPLKKGRKVKPRTGPLPIRFIVFADKVNKDLSKPVRKMHKKQTGTE